MQLLPLSLSFILPSFPPLSLPLLPHRIPLPPSLSYPHLFLFPLSLMYLLIPFYIFFLRSLSLCTLTPPFRTHPTSYAKSTLKTIGGCGERQTVAIRSSLERGCNFVPSSFVCGIVLWTWRQGNKSYPAPGHKNERCLKYPYYSRHDKKVQRNMKYYHVAIVKWK